MIFLTLIFYVDFFWYSKIYKDSSGRTAATKSSWKYPQDLSEEMEATWSRTI